MAADSDSARRYLPPLFDLERLFAGLRLLGKSPTAEDCRKHAGFARGSKILIAGEAGSGKTTLALAMVRALMVQWSSKFRHEEDLQFRLARHFGPNSAEKARTTPCDGDYAPVDHELCFLSTEVDVPRLRYLFSQYGWFTDQDKVFRFSRNGNKDGPTIVVPSITEAKVRLPLHGSGDVVDLVLMKVRDHYARSAKREIFVVVDSLTAILKDSRDPGERRRDSQQFLERLEEAIRPCSLALVFLIAERPPEPDPVAYADEVAADFVFRVSQTRTSPGRWLRTFTLAKSAGVNMTVGEHTWALLTDKTLDDVIAAREVAQWIRKTTEVQVEGQTPAASRSWATVGIFPKPQLGPIGRSNEPPSEEDPAEPARSSSGIPGLDELLTGHVEYWITHKRRPDAIAAGRTTLLVGTPGSGKTTMCLQFLAGEAGEAGEADASAASKQRKSRTLYVNFETPPADIATLYGRPNPNIKPFGGLLEVWHSLYRRRGNLDLNLLLAELRFVMKKADVQRVALDGLSDLLATTQRDDYSRMVEAVLGTIRDVNRNAVTLVAFEFDASRLESQFPAVEGLSATADNVVVLRRILINDEFRRTAYVLKARGLNPDVQVREIRITDDRQTPVQIWSGLESYSDLLSHHPRPVEVYLQLFSENSAERRVNEWLIARLTNLFGHKVHMFGFSRPAIARTLSDVTAAVGRIPHSDVKVVSLDEWWVREYCVQGQRPGQQPPAGKGIAEHPLLELDALFRSPSAGQSKSDPGAAADTEETGPQYRPSPGQFWVFEVEKASAVDHDETPPESNRTPIRTPRAHLLAVPNYTDFAMFCVNRQLLGELFDHDVQAHDPSSGPGSVAYRSATETANAWFSLLRDLPRAWVLPSSSGVLGFREPCPNVTERRALVDWMQAAVNRSKGGHKGFTFDMETSDTTVCMYLELCWAFGASEDFLVTDVVRFAGLSQTEQKEFIRNHAATHAMRLLQYLVFWGLMSPWPSLRNSQSSLFSRHWYSTISGWDESEGPGVSAPVDLDRRPFPLPFFPIGLDEDAKHDQLSNATREAYCDALTRFERLVERVLAALLYRHRDDQIKEVATAQSIREEAVSLRPIANRARSAKGTLIKRVETLRDLGSRLRKLALASSVLARGRIPGDKAGAGFRKCRDRHLHGLLPAARALNLRDVLELLTWHELRLDILKAELKNNGLHDVIARRVGAKSVPPAQDSSARGVSALTGYCSSGSWMVGAGRRTHNPLLSWKLMEELTSFEASVKRSQEGAGVPVRKDFYDICGDEQVRHVEHLTWNHLLLFGGARARRRDRTLCPGIPATPVFDTIYRQVLQCLTVAHASRADHESGATQAIRSESRALAESSVQAVEEIFKQVVLAMQKMGKTAPARRPRTCASCPAPRECKKVCGRATAADHPVR